MSDREDLAPAVERLLHDDLHLDVPSPDLDLIESGLLDSMALVDLIHRIEQVLGVRLDLETLDLEDWRTVRRIVELLARTRRGGTVE